MPFLVCSLCSVFSIQDVSPPSACCSGSHGQLASRHSYPSGTTSPNKPFVLQVALVLVSYHSKRKVTKMTPFPSIEKSSLPPLQTTVERVNKVLLKATSSGDIQKWRRYSWSPPQYHLTLRDPPQLASSSPTLSPLVLSSEHQGSLFVLLLRSELFTLRPDERNQTHC